jgi:hypothetical protein
VKPDSVHKNRTALVIGNADYLEGRLSAPVLDAQALAKVLRKLGFDVVERLNNAARSANAIHVYRCLSRMPHGYFGKRFP